MTETPRLNGSPIFVVLLWVAVFVGFIGATLVIGGGPLETGDVFGAALIGAIVTAVLLFSEEIKQLSWPRRIGLLLAASLAFGFVAALAMEVVGEGAVDIASARLVGIALFAAGAGAQSRLQPRLLRRA